MTTLIVTYPTREGARFDTRYYLARHIPLVREKWMQHGLISARALLPDQESPAYLAVALLEFTDGTALDWALASPEAATIFGDVAAFTDIAPVALRCAEWRG